MAGVLALYGPPAVAHWMKGWTCAHMVCGCAAHDSEREQTQNFMVNCSQRDN